MKIRFVLGIVALTTFHPPARAQKTDSETDSETDLFALRLVTFDLQEAGRLMTIYDRDEDGAIDKDEQERLRWKDEVKKFDLNKDGKLTHLEVAVREAHRRDEADVEQADINNVNTFLVRYDKNRNGQLDPDEIEGGWPSNPEDYDANGDGILTAKEMQYRFAFNRGLRREMGIEAVDQTGATQLVKRFDKDNNKQLDKQERAGAPLPRPAEEFDENDDGMLGIMELATMLAKHRNVMGLTKPDQTKIRRLFDMVDINGDGRITEQERNSPMGVAFGGNESLSGGDTTKSRYEQYDSNGDGVVTVREVEKVVAEVRKQRGYVEEDFKKAVTMLRRHDENRSKFIEESELFDQPKAGQLPKRILKSADLDKDGRINLDELSRYFAGVRKRK